MLSSGEKSSIRKNFVMNAILTMSSFIFPFITFPYISRTLLAEGMGKVSFALSLISYFTMFAEIGIPAYGIRAYAQVRDNNEKLSKVTQELFIISLITSAISYSTFLICLSTIPKMKGEKTLMLIISSVIVLSALGMEWLYMGLERYTYITVRSLVFKIISVIAMFLLVRSKEDYLFYGVLSVFAANASNVLNLLNVRKYVSIKPVGGYDFSRHFKPITVFFAMSCATMIYTRLDSVMLGFLAADADVGYYNVAVKVKIILTSIVASLGTVLMPRNSYYIQNKEFDRFFAVCNKAINFVFVISLPLVVFFIIFADIGIRLFAGPAFEQAVPAMRIVMPAVFLIGLSNILAIQMLVPLGKEKTVFYAEITGAAADLVLNFFLIPYYRSAGAAIGTLITETIVTLICWYALRKETSDGFRNISYWKIVLSILFGALSIIWVKFITFGDFLILFISSILFFCVYISFLYLMKEDLTYELVNQIFRRLKTILKKRAYN